MREQLIRQWQIVKLLSEHRYGLRTVQIANELNSSRQTVDRDLIVLRNAGVQISTDTKSGEKWHRFTGKPLPPLQPTPLQLAALLLARHSLAPLEGTRLLREIDNLLEGRAVDTALPHISLNVGRGKADVVRTIDSAIEHKRRVKIVYAAASHGGQVREYEIDPLVLRMVKQDLYLAGYDHASQSARRFKILRVHEATFLDAKAKAHPELDEQQLFGHGVKIWAGEVTRVVVILKAEVVPLVPEYPLAKDQECELQPDGSARITARVAGLIEAKQWVLGWGSSAIAVEPAELRQAVKGELTKALAEYGDPGPRPVRAIPRKGPSLATARSDAKATLAVTRHNEARGIRSGQRR